MECNVQLDNLAISGNLHFIVGPMIEFINDQRFSGMLCKLLGMKWLAGFLEQWSGRSLDDLDSVFDIIQCGDGRCLVVWIVLAINTETLIGLAILERIGCPLVGFARIKTAEIWIPL